MNPEMKRHSSLQWLNQLGMEFQIPIIKVKSDPVHCDCFSAFVLSKRLAVDRPRQKGHFLHWMLFWDSCM